MQKKSNFDFAEGEILLVHKPYEWTSFDVVNKIKIAIEKNTGKKIKVGHAGTLDPLATGLLIICTGKATKKIEPYQNLDKVYTGTMFLGATTPSFDREKEVDKNFETSHIDVSLLEKTVQQFTGEIQQVPPVFSAIKTGGKAAYLKARKGHEFQLQPRTVFIKKFEIISVALPLVHFLVECSKGTYIRSLIHDFGKAAGSGAYLYDLCRTHIGRFSLNESFDLPELLQKIQEQKAV